MREPQQAHAQRAQRCTAMALPGHRGDVSSSLAAALAMTTPTQLVYRSDCGVPCTSEATMDRNLMALLNFDGLTNDEKTAVGTNALGLFPAATARLAEPSCAHL